jgi:hypothetical protein
MNMKELGIDVPNTYRLYGREEMVSINPSDVPPRAADFFCTRSKLLTRNPALDIHQFDMLFKLDRDDRVSTFFAAHDKYYGHIDTTDRAVYLFDVLQTGEEIGYSELFYELGKDNSEPIVMMTRTLESYRNQGFGTQRLLAMNAVSQVFFYKPLRSDSRLTVGAVCAWDHLVSAGYAEKFTRERSRPHLEPLQLYRFIGSVSTGGVPPSGRTSNF